MLRLSKGLVALVGILAICFFSSSLATWPERLIVGGGSIVIFLISTAVIFERIRRFVEGYHTSLSGGADDGDLLYQEGTGRIRFYFKRRSHTVYIPTDKIWLDVMPNWAKQNKEVIIKRVKSQLGRHWSFEDTEKPEHILRQE